MVALGSAKHQRVSTYQDVTGFSPQDGAQVSFGFPTNGTFSASATYAAGAWSPFTPILTNGQAAFFYVPCITNCITMTSFADKTYPCGTTNWSFDPPTNIVDTCCTNFTVTNIFASISGPCPSVTISIWLISDACGNSNSAACSFTVTVITTTNCCCSGCTAPYPYSYTNTVVAGYNFLADNLCQGTNNLVNEVLTNFSCPVCASGNVNLLLWDPVHQSYSSSLTYYDAADAAPLPAGWYDQNGNPATNRISPGEGFIFNNLDGPFTITISGCVPGCKPPCSPPTNGYVLVGGLGLGTATWTNLFSCPPPCGAEMLIWNGAGYTVYDYYNQTWHNVNGNVVPAPVLGVGQSAFVTLKPMTGGGMTVNCPGNKTVPCGVAWTFDRPTGTSCCSSNVTILSLGAVTNGLCPEYATNNWLIYDSCGDTNICSQVVTVINTNPPTVTCAQFLKTVAVTL